MKARKLKKLLNDTKYTVAQDSDSICIGSTLCHDLISVNKQTLYLKYALDTWHKGREALLKSNDELLFIWDTLKHLIDSGEIRDIIDGNDEIENPLPVYTVRDGKLIETFTDHYGWPNTTIEGYIMYDNTYFDNMRHAIQYGVREYDAGVEFFKKRIVEIKSELVKYEGLLQEDIEKLNYFLSL